MKDSGSGCDHPQKPLTAMVLIFMLCSILQYIETLLVRTDETFFADNFIHKALGIIILAFCIRLFKYSWVDIGFRIDKIKYLGYGFALGFLCFLIAYTIEYLTLKFQGLSPSLEIYVSGFALSGDVAKQTGLLSISLCILFNIINVVMEEGFFRGLFIKLGTAKLGFVRANWLAALLFGIWHLCLPVKSLVDGEMNLTEALVMGIGYIILASLMGIKWGLWLRNTKCLWFGMSEHFFNNTIGNILHIASLSGDDELQILRIIIAQMISLAITLVINRRTRAYRTD